jgi:hypothetical protein
MYLTCYLVSSVDDAMEASSGHICIEDVVSMLFLGLAVVVIILWPFTGLQ